VTRTPGECQCRSCAGIAPGAKAAGI
jgi:hypothetical protein